MATGICYKISDKKILHVVPDVIEATNDSIRGKNKSIGGVNTNLCKIIVVEDSEENPLNLSPDDILPDGLVDIKADFMPELDKIKAENANLHQAVDDLTIQLGDALLGGAI
jgi:hypothetical protein